MSETIEIVADGAPICAERGTTVASALLNAAHHSFRRSITGEQRAPLCGMGICYECRVTIDGVAHLRACMVVVEPAMRVDTAERTP